MTTAVLAITFVTVTLMVGIILSLLTASQRALSKRLETLAQQEEAAPQQQAERDLAPLVTRLLAAMGKLRPLEQTLARAGIPMRPSEFLLLCVLGIVGLTAVGWVLTRLLLVAVLCALIGTGLCPLIVSMLTGRRRLAFESQLADALVLMASSLRSGYSVLRAIQTVSEEMTPPISTEFGRVSEEVALGLAMDDALVRLAQRVPSYDLEMMVTAVNIQIEVGGNLADILETLASTIRERNRIRAEMQALTAEGRLSGIVLVLLPLGLAVFIQLVNPRYFSALVGTAMGQVMIACAIVLQIIGGLVIKRMLEMDF